MRIAMITVPSQAGAILARDRLSGNAVVDPEEVQADRNPTEMMGFAALNPSYAVPRFVL